MNKRRSTITVPQVPIASLKTTLAPVARRHGLPVVERHGSLDITRPFNLTVSVVSRGNITEVTVNRPKIAVGARDAIEGERRGVLPVTAR